MKIPLRQNRIPIFFVPSYPIRFSRPLLSLLAYRLNKFGPQILPPLPFPPRNILKLSHLFSSFVHLSLSLCTWTTHCLPPFYTKKLSSSSLLVGTNSFLNFTSLVRNTKFNFLDFVASDLKVPPTLCLLAIDSHEESDASLEKRSIRGKDPKFEIRSSAFFTYPVSPQIHLQYIKWSLVDRLRMLALSSASSISRPKSSNSSFSTSHSSTTTIQSLGDLKSLL